MTKFRNDHGAGGGPVALKQELRLWEEHWTRSSKELNQWEILLEYGNGKSVDDSRLVLESAWRTPNWSLMKDSLHQVRGGKVKRVLGCFSLWRTRQL